MWDRFALTFITNRKSSRNEEFVYEYVLEACIGRRSQPRPFGKLFC